MGNTVASDDKWQREWEIERDLEALCRAEAVKKDPKRLERAKALAKKKLEENKARLAETQRMFDMGEGKNP
jgi:hypothetical protein